MSIEGSGAENPRLGERLTVTIETLAAGGDGIARVAGFTLFVPRSAPGDVAEVEVVSVTRNFGRALLLRLLTPGPDRVSAPCPLAEGCPGCQLQHLSYPAQLAAKRQFVRDGLERIGRLKGIDVRPTLGMDDPWHYRNKGEFVADVRAGEVRLGYHGEGDGSFVPLPDCPIQHPLTMTVVRAVEAVATQLTLPLAQVITRVSPSEGAALVILVCRDWSPQLPEAAQALQARVPELAGVLWSRVRGHALVRRTPAEPLLGRTALLQELGKWQYTVSAESFFQVNNLQAVRLLELAGEFAGEMREEIFSDGYCGVGTFLIPLASRALRSFGIEEHPAAIGDAKENMARYAVHDVHLYEGRVEAIFPRLARKGRAVDVAVLDPPRKGAWPRGAGKSGGVTGPPGDPGFLRPGDAGTRRGRSDRPRLRNFRRATG